MQQFWKTCFALALVSSVAAPAAISPGEIIHHGEQQLRGRSLQGVMRMQISHGSFSRELSLRTWTMGNEKALVVIRQPTKEEGISSLRVENQMWNYLPKVDQIVRVPTSLMLQSWMGSDFTNDDLMKMSSLNHDYNHKSLRREKIDGEPADLIECTPKPGAPVVWGKILYWARTSDRLPVRQQFFDDHGALVRTLNYSGFKRMDDRVVPTILTMEKAGPEKESTTVTYEKLLFDRKVPDDLFARDQMKRISQRGRNLKSEWASQPLPPVLNR